jgi:GNAT superfamily N-acetyltransferase
VVKVEKFSEHDLDIEILSDGNASKTESFRCYEKELEDFLAEDALNNQNAKISVTYLIFQKAGKNLVGYMTVLNDSINLNADLKEFFKGKDIMYKSLPAMKIGRMAVHDDYQDKGVGSFMILFAINLASRIGESSGCRFIIVDSKRNHSDPAKDPIHFYKKKGFKVLREREKGTTAMYLDLYLKEK